MTKNEQRANARRAFDAYVSAEGLDTGHDSTTVIDLITDLLHLNDTFPDNAETGEIRFTADTIIDSAHNHYDAEVKFGDDEEQHA